VRELTDEAGLAQAWTLARLALDLDADAIGFGGEPTVLILDEAGMASTRETARVLQHAHAAAVKVIAIGDSGQLSSVQAGGWLGSLTRRLGSYELREVMRQRDPRERQLLASVRRGDPTAYIDDKTSRGRLHIYAGDAETARAGEQAAIVAWRERQDTYPWGQAVLIARDNTRRARLNALVRAQLARDGRLGDSVHVAGHEFAVGDRVIARRNDRLRAVDNGMRGTVIAVDPTENEVIVRSDAGAQRALDAAYVAEHLQHAYALTAHTIQGGTVEWAGVVGHPDDFTRNWSYTALSRAREPTEIFVIYTPTERELDLAEIAPDRATELGDRRTPLQRLGAAMRKRDDEDLALDRIDAVGSHTFAAHELPEAGPAAAIQTGRPVDELRTELAQLRQRIGRGPDPLVDQLRIARSTLAEAQRAADEARARIDDLERPAGGLLRRRTGDPAALALERERLKLAERQVAAATEREQTIEAHLHDRTAREAEHKPLRERAAALEAQLSICRREHLCRALEPPAPYLTAALGPLPAEPRARRTWQQAAQRIEAYRFDHAITDTNDALGHRPATSPELAQWQRAQQDVHHAQRDLGYRAEQGLWHEL
jgi:hypothetical protein